MSKNHLNKKSLFVFVLFLILINSGNNNQQTFGQQENYEPSRNLVLNIQQDSMDHNDHTQPQNEAQIMSGQEEESHHYHQPNEPEFWYNVVIAIVCVCTGAFCSGLTVGLCNLDSLQLQVMAISKNPEEQKIAKTILAVIKDHHLFLCTLLLYNAIALESLPLIIHTLMPDWAAILFSTLFVLIGAQIVPQAVCTGSRKMSIAYRASPIIMVMTKVLWILIYPMAKGLDWLFGQHDHKRIQHQDFANFLTGNKGLKKTQKMLLTSTLQLRCQRVEQKMIPLKNLYMIQMKEELNQKKIQQIRRKQYFYILVYRESRDNIVGIIKAKEFALKFLKLRNKQVLYAEQFIDQNIDFLSVYKDTNMLQMLMLFQANHSRVALVCDQKKKIQPGIKSIMYTKTDMIIKKKSNIIGAIFLYTIFAQITQSEQNIPTQIRQSIMGEKKQMRQMNQPLLKH